MDSYIVLIILCTLLISSYIFDWISRATRFPSVLLLVATGIILKLVCYFYNIKVFDFNVLLPTLGTIGLVLIVLEGALELKFERSKLPVIRRAFLAALLLLILSWLGIAFGMRYFTGAGLQQCMLNAVPFSVISSAIAIPSVAGIEEEKREFIIYESTFSDILGIVLFNFVLSNQEISGLSFLNLGIDVVAVLLIAFIFSLALLYIMGSITHHVKFFLLIAILLLVYALGKIYHLSTLVIVLIFGLFINNASLINNIRFRRIFIYEGLSDDLKQFFILSAESAFLMRTLFFVVFGFTMALSSLTHLSVLLYGFLIFALLFLSRLLYLRIFLKKLLSPTVFVMPRGLISILLFYSIPEAQRLEGFGQGVMLFVVIASTLFMTFGLMGNSEETKEAVPAETE